MPKKTKEIKYYQAVGRRKESVAIVRLYIVGKNESVDVDNLKIKRGEIFVNGKPIESIFNSIDEKTIYLRPLKLTENQDRFAISIKVSGGGLLTRDPRTRERRKVGTGGKARREKQSPKR